MWNIQNDINFGVITVIDFFSVLYIDIIDMTQTPEPISPVIQSQLY